VLTGERERTEGEVEGAIHAAAQQVGFAQIPEPERLAHGAANAKPLHDTKVVGDMRCSASFLRAGLARWHTPALSPEAYFSSTSKL
jgi:hypothetical protein